MSATNDEKLPLTANPDRNTHPYSSMGESTSGNPQKQEQPNELQAVDQPLYEPAAFMVPEPFNIVANIQPDMLVRNLQAEEQINFGHMSPEKYNTDFDSNQTDAPVRNIKIDMPVPPNVSPQIQEQTNSAMQYQESSTNWQNSEKKAIYKLAVRVDSLRMMHHLASRHYRARNLCFHLIPNLVLSLSSSVLSVYNSNADKIVAILTAGIAFVEALNRFLEYESSEAMHRQAAATLSKIKTDCQILLAEVPKKNIQGVVSEIMDGDDNMANSTTEEKSQKGKMSASDKFHNSRYYWGKKKSVTDRFDMVQEAIDRPLPVHIEGAYELLSVHLSGNTELRRNVHGSLKAVNPNEGIETEAYSYASEVLFSVICSAHGWPLFLSSSISSVRVLERRFEELHLPLDESITA